MNYLAIALVILIIIILYSFFAYITNNALVAGLQPLNTPLSWTFEKLLNTTSTSYSYQCWLFITANPATGTHPIFFRGESKSVNEFNVSLDASLNLTVGAKQSSAIAAPIVMTVMNGFPLQKWVYLTINVRQNVIEAYINGKLTKTVSTNNPITPSMRAGLTIGNTALQGYLSKFYRLDKVLDAATVEKNYLSGNGLNNWYSTIFPYGMNLTITNADSASKLIKVF